MSNANKLALGTVQFGMDYGINNQKGQVKAKELHHILQLAHQEGIELLDTAYAYGNSELQLGKSPISPFKIVSKLPPQATEASLVPIFFDESLKRLQQKKLYGYLLHRFQTYIEKPQVWHSMQALKTSGRVLKLGFSLYSIKELELILKKKVAFDLLQIPFNLFDRRFVPYFEKLKELGVEIHTRSTFLQGLFFKSPHQLPSHFESIRYKLDILHNIAKDNQVDIADICLSFALVHSSIDKVVIGVDSVEQLEANLRAVPFSDRIHPILSRLLELEEQDENIINPSKWKL